MTNKQNRENSVVTHASSGRRGVYADRHRWRVIVVHNGVRVNGGMHDTVEQADQVARAIRADLYTHNPTGA